MAPSTALQASLFGAAEPRIDPDLAGRRRRQLGHGAWVDHLPGWVDGADELFARVHAAGDWGQGTMEMYGERVRQPRLTSWWTVDELGRGPLAGLEVLADVAAALSRAYDVAFTSVGCNLYRDGRDSVAWHGDRVARDLPTSTIAIVSLGAHRPFKLRPRGGGPSIDHRLGRGDLLVMGGSCQRTWQHTVPKVALAEGPRISVTFRHAHPAAPR